MLQQRRGWKARGAASMQRPGTHHGASDFPESCLSSQQLSAPKLQIFQAADRQRLPDDQIVQMGFVLKET